MNLSKQRIGKGDFSDGQSADCSELVGGVGSLIRHPLLTSLIDVILISCSLGSQVIGLHWSKCVCVHHPGWSGLHLVRVYHIPTSSLSLRFISGDKEVYEKLVLSALWASSSSL